MKIELSSNEIKQAIIASLAGNISLTGKETTVTFTSGRSKNTLTASVVIADKGDGTSPISPMPEFNDDEETKLVLVEQTETDKVENLDDNVKEPETKTTTGSIFKAVTKPTA